MQRHKIQSFKMKKGDCVMKYPEIQQIIDTMAKAGYDCKKKIEEIEVMQQRATLGTGFEVCTDKPPCVQCGVYNCPSRTCPSLV